MTNDKRISAFSDPKDLYRAIRAAKYDFGRSVFGGRISSYEKPEAGPPFVGSGFVDVVTTGPYRTFRVPFTSSVWVATDRLHHPRVGALVIVCFDATDEKIYAMLAPAVEFTLPEPPEPKVNVWTRLGLAGLTGWKKLLAAVRSLLKRN